MVDKSKFIVFSLCGGLEPARIALDRLGINSTEVLYFSSEIDRAALKVSAAQHCDIIQLGDLR